MPQKPQEFCASSNNGYRANQTGRWAKRSFAISPAKKALAFLAVLILCCTACDTNIKDEQLTFRIATITNLFGEGYSATVQGMLTDTDWSGVPDKVETALNGAFTGGTNPQQGRFRAVFTHPDGVTITVEKNTTYTYWKTFSDGKTLYLNLNALNSVDLQTKIRTAIDSMDDFSTGSE